MEERKQAADKHRRPEKKKRSVGEVKGCSEEGEKGHKKTKEYFYAELEDGWVHE